MTDITVNTLVESKYAEDSQTKQYTSTDVKTMVDKFTATNATASDVTFVVNLAAGTTAEAAANVVLNKTILAGTSYPCPEIVGHELDDTGFISTLAGTASAIVIRISGRKIA